MNDVEAAREQRSSAGDAITQLGVGPARLGPARYPWIVDDTTGLIYSLLLTSASTHQG